MFKPEMKRRIKSTPFWPAVIALALVGIGVVRWTMATLWLDDHSIAAWKAIRNNDKEALGRLLDRGLGPNAAIYEQADFHTGLLDRFDDDTGWAADRERSGTWRAPMLVWAAAFGKNDAMELLIARGADVDGSAPFGPTPLMCVAHTGNIAMVNLLLAHGAKVNYAANYGSTPLMEAAGDAHLDIVRVLLDHGADARARGQYGKTPLYYAVSGTDRENATVRAQRIAIIGLMAAHGADPKAATTDGASILCRAAESGEGELVAAVLAHGADVRSKASGGLTPLMVAANHDDPAAAEVLLRAGAGLNAINENGDGALTIAAAHPRTLETLLKHGAKLSVYNRKLPLAVACGEGNTESVRRLLAAMAAETSIPGESLFEISLFDAVSTSAIPRTQLGKDDERRRMEIVRLLLQDRRLMPHSQPSLQNALVSAAASGYVSIVALLVRQGAQIDAPDASGSTALRQAVAYDRITVVKKLLALGGKVNAADRYGYTAMDSCGNQNTDIAPVLIRAGGRSGRALRVMRLNAGIRQR